MKYRMILLSWGLRLAAVGSVQGIDKAVDFSINLFTTGSDPVSTGFREKLPVFENFVEGDDFV